jgi:hypothetical protein
MLPLTVHVVLLTAHVLLLTAHCSLLIAYKIASLELTQVMTRDYKIRGTRLKVTVEHVDTVQAARCMCNELDILRVQGIEYMLK